MTTAPLPPGASIDGRYLVGEVIGKGGAGTVVAAHHVALNAPVAIKFLRPSALSHDSRKRFLREARLTHRLKSAHAIQIHDVGELESGDLFLVMELLVGRNLAEEIAARKSLPEHEAAELIAQACEAVGEAHALGIVHRDLKPQNLFIHQSARGPILKVLDFGLSKEVEGEAPRHTRTFMFMGTPRYMPPEQWEPGAVADPRMDVYALGVVLHELLTGEVPFEHVPLRERAPLILGASTPDPRSVRPSISERMAEIVMSCLNPRAEERVPSARHLERMLRGLATSSGPSGGATLMLSKIVPSKTQPGIAASADARALGASTPPPASPPASLAGPSLGVGVNQATFALIQPPPPVLGSVAPPALAPVAIGLSTPPPPAVRAPSPMSLPPSPVANVRVAAIAPMVVPPDMPQEMAPAEEEEESDRPARIVLWIGIFLLLVLAAITVVALLEATGQLRR